MNIHPSTKGLVLTLKDIMCSNSELQYITKERNIIQYTITQIRKSKREMFDVDTYRTSFLIRKSTVEFLESMGYNLFRQFETSHDYEYFQKPFLKISADKANEAFIFVSLLEYSLKIYCFFTPVIAENTLPHISPPVFDVHNPPAGNTNEYIWGSTSPLPTALDLTMYHNIWGKIPIFVSIATLYSTRSRSNFTSRSTTPVKIEIMTSSNDNIATAEPSNSCEETIDCKNNNIITSDNVSGCNTLFQKVVNYPNHTYLPFDTNENRGISMSRIEGQIAIYDGDSNQNQITEPQQYLDVNLERQKKASKSKLNPKKRIPPLYLPLVWSRKSKDSRKLLSLELFHPVEYIREYNRIRKSNLNIIDCLRKRECSGALNQTKVMEAIAEPHYHIFPPADKEDIKTSLDDVRKKRENMQLGEYMLLCSVTRRNFWNFPIEMIQVDENTTTPMIVLKTN